MSEQFLPKNRQNLNLQMPSHEEYTVELTKAPSLGLLARLAKAIHTFRSLPQRIYNTFLLFKHRELKKPASKNVCPMRYLNPFLYLHYSTKIVSKSAVIKAILKYPRKDPEGGLFNDQDNAMVFLPVLQDLYPEETITPEDFIFTCNKESLRKYRQPILRFIGPQSIEKQSKELEAVIEDTIQFYCKEEQERYLNNLKSWELDQEAPQNSCPERVTIAERQGSSEDNNFEVKPTQSKTNFSSCLGISIDATEFSFVLAVAVMSRLLLGHPGPFHAYREIASAVDLVNRYMMKKTLKQPLSKEEKEGYKESLLTLRSAIDTSFHSQGPFSHGSFVETLREEKQLTPLQVKMSLYAMYSAGSDTSSSLLNYLLWQLGKHPEFQEEIFNEMRESKEDLFTYANQSEAIGRVFSESLRLFTPAYVIGRISPQPLICTIKDKSGNILCQERIEKNEKLLSMPTFAARDPFLFQNPDEFHPHRFNNPSKGYSWFPFGDGAHSCPGQWLAKAEISMITAILIRRYRFDSSPKQEFQQLGYISLKSSEQVQLKLFPRR